MGKAKFFTLLLLLYLTQANVKGVKFSDWCRLTETELAERLGLSRRFFYGYMHWGERVYGFSMLHYYVLCLLRQGATVREAADRAGLSWRTAQTMGRCLDSVIMDGLPLDTALLPPYEPRPVRRGKKHGNVVLAALRDLTRGEDGIIDRITPEVLEAVEKRGRAYVGP